MANFISKITPPGSNISYNLHDVEVIYPDSTSTASSFVGVTAASSLYSGKTIAVVVASPCTSIDTVVLQNGNGTSLSTITLDSSYVVGEIVFLVYSGTNWDIFRKSNYYYGTCATAAATQAKVVTCLGFKLYAGATIGVRFTNGQTYNGAPTLNVNGTGAINVQYAGGTDGIRYMWNAGEIIDFTYDGTAWVAHSRGIASTTYYGITKLNNTTSSTSTSLAATANSVRLAYNRADEAYNKAPRVLDPSVGDNYYEIGTTTPSIGMQIMCKISITSSVDYIDTVYLTAIDIVEFTVTLPRPYTTGELLWLVYDGTGWKIPNDCINYINSLNGNGVSY